MKRDVGIAYIAMRKIHYNVMRCKDTLSVDEAEVLAGRFSSLSGRHYVLHDPEKLADKYAHAWNNILKICFMFHEILKLYIFYTIIWLDLMIMMKIINL